MADPNKVVDFENPPVMEVVFGAMFAPLRGLQSPHLGRLWASMATDFPRCLDVPPLPPTPEETDGRVHITMMMSNLPELPRVWLLSEDSRTIVQLQRDRLHVNRRRTVPEDEYEGFDVAMSRFEGIWEGFRGFTQDQCKEEPTVTQLELTYVNVVPACALFDHLGQVGRVFPIIAWPESGKEFLKEPDAIDAKLSFRLPENLGRLHVTVRGRNPRGGEPMVFNMELTARGRPRTASPDDRASWFRIARNAIDRGFVDFTNPTMQTEIWRRTR